ncbi:putative lrr receptor-like serine/threonine-protein kinase [Quercus suber]|uniref:non-specific serine/threonine protein kinase n=1 Tax=Quercus suber TaxID=58331 RepID=A0AAW0L9W6_QUESU
MVRSPPFLALAFCAAIIFGQLLEVAQSQSQNKAQPRTDPAEVRALNSVFQKWGISAQPDQWNISGEPCSGAAIDSTNFDDPNRNPFIKCDCSFNNSSTCHITQLKVSDLDVVGVIPEELWSLTFLFNLNLSQNYLTGSLSVSIGNLTSMQYLTLAFNALSGMLPKELGNLMNLISLSLSTNKFSGSLPSELGNLVKLEEFNFDSSGISGELPSTFAKLQNLQIVWASDTNLTGRIPDFIGTWSNLVSLRISGLSNGSSSLAFIKDMKRLRNNDISDSIPSNIGEYQQLSFLDLSYNYLVGSSLPSWVNQPNLQLNLVANNFTLENSSCVINHLDQISWTRQIGHLLCRLFLSHISIIFRLHYDHAFDKWSLLAFSLAMRLYNKQSILDHGFDSGFAIKCGGPNLTTSTQTRYERENETLGPAAYYVTNTNKWAVSNVGLFTGRTKPAQTSYSDTISTNFAIFTNDFGPEFFQTARLSASSLRYYGLGLQNGNYIVTLQFAETVFPDNKTWKSLGKRMFDIYIQGNLVSQDFDIRKEAGGSYIGIERDFPAQVSENYLEIHFFWAGKGTCCIPVEGTYGPSISVISAINNNPFLVPNATTEFTPSSRSSNGNLIGLIVGISIGVGGILSVFIVFYIIRKRKRLQTNHNEEGLASNSRGTLNDGRVVAVKQLSAASHQGKNQFVTEIAIMSAVQHRNLVKFGYLAPEYAMRGHLTEKTDVFAFGIVALEMVSGRRNSDPSLEEEKMYLLEWAWQLHEDKREVDLVDVKLSEFNEEEVKRVIRVSFLCTQSSPTLRPSMSRVVAMLLGDIEVSTVTSKPGYLTDWKSDDPRSLRNDVATRGNVSIYYDYSESSSMVGYIDNSPVSASKPMLGKAIKQGR